MALKVTVVIVVATTEAVTITAVASTLVANQKESPPD